MVKFLSTLFWFFYAFSYSTTPELNSKYRNYGRRFINWSNIWLLGSCWFCFRRALRIVIPSKIRYVHHHHTHVLLMKPQRISEPKYHHLHYYQDGGRKSKGVNHHIYIPVVPPPEDEAEDESIAKYAISPPSNKYEKPNSFFSGRKSPSVYEEPPPPSPPKKFLSFDRSSVGSYSPEEEREEYYEADPFFPTNSAEVYRPFTYDYNALKLQSKYLIRHKEPLFYPETKSFTTTKESRF